MAPAVHATCRSAGAILVQDYHLYPLPALLRQRLGPTPILHFTHIPFLDVGLMKLLPESWRDAILRGLLGADVVGVQTEGDRRAFLDCCAQLLQVPVDTEKSTVRTEDGRQVRVAAYPASVDVVALTADM